MEEFTSKNLDIVRKDLESVLEVAAEHLGISLTLGAFRYNEGEFTLKLTGVTAGENGEIRKPYEKAYTDLAKLNDNMRPLGYLFTFNGGVYSIAGWKPRGIKYKLLGEGTNGKLYKFSERFAYIDPSKENM